MQPGTLPGLKHLITPEGAISGHLPHAEAGGQRHLQEDRWHGAKEIEPLVGRMGHQPIYMSTKVEDINTDSRKPSMMPPGQIAFTSSLFSE